MRSSKMIAVPVMSICWLLMVGAMSLSAASSALAMSSSPAFAPSARGSAGTLAAANTCSGTQEAPGVLAGSYRGTVKIEGECVVDGGPAVVSGNLTITEGSALLAAFANNDVTGRGRSRLVVHGSVHVRAGATLLMGCEPGYFPCFDDPNPGEATLSSRGEVFGSIVAHEALGVVLHASVIHGNVLELGGGGGAQCVPQGPFTEFPPYSDYEDLTIGGRLVIANLQSCWLGIARTHVAGNLLLHGNQLADPDAIEVLANTVEGNLACRENSMVWDSVETSEEGVFPRAPEPNTVAGARMGQCVLASPTTEGGTPGPGAF